MDQNNTTKKNQSFSLFRNKNLPAIAQAIENAPELKKNEDIVFEGLSEKDSSQTVISLQGCSPKELAMLASNVKKPNDWAGKIILLGGSTHSLCASLSKEYYQFTGKCVDVLGLKEDLFSIDGLDGNPVIGFRWKKEDDSPNKPNLSIITSDRSLLLAFCTDLKRGFDYLKRLYLLIYETRSPDKVSELEQSIKNLFARFREVNNAFHNGIKNSKSFTFQQTLTEQDISLISKFRTSISDFLTNCLSYTEPKMYEPLKEMDLMDLTEWFTDFIDKMHQKKEELRLIFSQADLIDRCFHLKELKKPLDLSDPDMVFISKYNPSNQ